MNVCNNFLLNTLLHRPVVPPKSPKDLCKRVTDSIDQACDIPDPRFLTSPENFSRKSKLGLADFVKMYVASFAQPRRKWLKP